MGNSNGGCSGNDSTADKAAPSPSSVKNRSEGGPTSKSSATDASFGKKRNKYAKDPHHDIFHGQSFASPALGEPRYAVKLRVYNLQQAMKRGSKHFTTSMGFGFFHSAVEIFDREWQFGGNMSAAPEDCGIFYLPPETIMPKQQVYEVLTLGYLPNDVANFHIELIVRARLIPNWTALSYHVLSHNCNHFAEAFVDLLNEYFGTKMEVPSFVNRAARFGDVFVPEAILKSMMSQTPQAPTGQQQGGSNKNSSASPSTLSPSASKEGGGVVAKKKDQKLGHNPTITRADGKHYTIDGVPLKDFQGWSAGYGHGAGGADAGPCHCGNPYCRRNPNGFYARNGGNADDSGYDRAKAADEEPPTPLPPIPTNDEMKSMPIRQLKTVMWVNGISWDGCVEKSDLIAAVQRYKDSIATVASPTTVED